METFSFTVGSTGFSLDFSTMAQTNCVTGLRRDVRRRPKFTSNTGSFSTSSASSCQLTDGGYKWEFMGEEGEWTEYEAHVCSFDSAAIERRFQQNLQGQLLFKTKRHSYTLDSSRMCQVNDKCGTADDGSQQNSSSGTLPCWQFKDMDGVWKDYSRGSSISSQDIELQYQQNPSGTVMFTTKEFNYELNLSAMSQKNLSTSATRPVRRLHQ